MLSQGDKSGCREDFSLVLSSFGHCGKHRGDDDAVRTGTVVAAAPQMLPLMLLNEAVCLFFLNPYCCFYLKKNKSQSEELLGDMQETVSFSSAGV